MDLWSFRKDVGQERADLRGMAVKAVDGRVGKVEDVVEAAGASFLVVDTGTWIFGKKVMLPAGVVRSIDVDSSTIDVDRTKEEIKDAPEYEDDQRDDSAYREALDRHYATH